MSTQGSQGGGHRVGAGLLGGAGASVTAVCAGETVVAAGGCLGEVHGDVEPPWWGWWGAGWAATRQVPISAFFPYLILIE